jgi:Glycosyl transferase family 11
VLDGTNLRESRRELPVVRIDNDDFGEPEDFLARLADDTRYVGWFQSERFFAGAEAEVEAAFTLRPEHEAAFADAYPDLLRTAYICCHVRRTDYVSFAGGAHLPPSYYRAALRLLGAAADLPVVFVGDDLSDVRRAFRRLPRVRFEQNDVALDHQLIRRAESVIVSNSTFGWWGAWLNRTPRKRVLAPRLWLGFTFGWEYPHRVVPAGWTQLPVRRRWRTRLSPSGARTTAAMLRRRIGG